MADQSGQNLSSYLAHPHPHATLALAAPDDGETATPLPETLQGRSGGSQPVSPRSLLPRRARATTRRGRRQSGTAVLVQCREVWIGLIGRVAERGLSNWCKLVNVDERREQLQAEQRIVTMEQPSGSEVWIWGWCGNGTGVGY